MRHEAPVASCQRCPDSTTTLDTLVTQVSGESTIRGGTAPTTQGSTRAAALWGVVVGGMQAASPLAFWWLTPATVYALGLALIAAVYIGFAVADGRSRVIAAESSVAATFVVLAAAAVTGPAWLLVVGYAGHGAKDLWQHRRRYVTQTRWWPPFCLAIDWIVALVIALEIATGVHLHQ